MFRKIFCLVLTAVFIANSILPSCAQGVLLGKGMAGLPEAGTMVGLSSALTPAVLRGIRVSTDDPLKFEFILDPGDKVREARARGREDEAMKTEARETSQRLVNYFLTTLTVPDEDIWVNLSPYEKDRITPEKFGQTEMGRDLLAQDYLLKQITATLLYPEGESGKKFWARVYEEAERKFGTTNIPVDTFNKVWIMPEKAEIYEKVDSATGKAAAFIVNSSLKVMLESDYLAMNNNQAPDGSLAEQAVAGDTQDLGRAVAREVIIPLLQKEVNEGANFAPLRQVYGSIILALWYKEKLKNSVLASVYVDRNKVAGVDVQDKEVTRKIWGQYVEAFKKGAVNYVREEKDAISGESIPRKYFAGGFFIGKAFRMIVLATFLATAAVGFDTLLTSCAKVEDVTPAITLPAAPVESYGIDGAEKTGSDKGSTPGFWSRLVFTGKILTLTAALLISSTWYGCEKYEFKPAYYMEWVTDLSPDQRAALDHDLNTSASNGLEMTLWEVAKEFDRILKLHNGDMTNASVQKRYLEWNAFHLLVNRLRELENRLFKVVGINYSELGSSLNSVFMYNENVEGAGVRTVGIWVFIGNAQAVLFYIFNTSDGRSFIAPQYDALVQGKEYSLAELFYPEYALEWPAAQLAHDLTDNINAYMRQDPSFITPFAMRPADIYASLAYGGYATVSDARTASENGVVVKLFGYPVADPLQDPKVVLPKSFTYKGVTFGPLDPGEFKAGPGDQVAPWVYPQAGNTTPAITLPAAPVESYGIDGAEKTGSDKGSTPGFWSRLVFTGKILTLTAALLLSLNWYGCKKEYTPYIPAYYSATLTALPADDRIALDADIAAYEFATNDIEELLYEQSVTLDEQIKPSGDALTKPYSQMLYWQWYATDFFVKKLKKIKEENPDNPEMDYTTWEFTNESGNLLSETQGIGSHTVIYYKTHPGWPSNAPWSNFIVVAMSTPDGIRHSVLPQDYNFLPFFFPHYTDIAEDLQGLSSRFEASPGVHPVKFGLPNFFASLDPEYADIEGQVTMEELKGKTFRVPGWPTENAPLQVTYMGVTFTLFNKGDFAESAPKDKKKPVKVDPGKKRHEGGIDLKRSSMPLETRNQGGIVNFKIDPAAVRDLDLAPGLRGQVLEIAPLQSLPAFLGMSKDEEAKQILS